MDLAGAHCTPFLSHLYTGHHTFRLFGWKTQKNFTILEGQLAAENALFVARDNDVTALKNLWTEAKTGEAKLVRLQAPFGGGRRALMAEVNRQISASDEDAIVWRVNCVEQENGLQWLIRMYGSLVGTLGEDVLRRGRAEMVLNSQLPSQPKRVQNWYQEFIATLKDSKADKETGQIQLRLPRDNPLLGLVEIVSGLARRIPLLLEIQNPQLVYSVETMWSTITPLSTPCGRTSR